MRRYFVAIVIWLLVPITIVGLPYDLPGYTCLAMLFLYLVGACLQLAYFILFFLTRHKPQAAIAFFVTSSLWLFCWSNGFTVGAKIHLFVNENRYAEKIKQLTRATSAEERERICAEECMANSELQIVTFHYCHCPFFWPDLVYDPGGALDVNRSELKKVSFYLNDARHLRSFWYIGYYGD